MASAKMQKQKKTAVWWIYKRLNQNFKFLKIKSRVLDNTIYYFPAKYKLSKVLMQFCLSIAQPGIKIITGKPAPQCYCHCQYFQQP